MLPSPIATNGILSITIIGPYLQPVLLNAANVVPVARSTQSAFHAYARDLGRSCMYSTWTSGCVLRATGTTLAALDRTGSTFINALHAISISSTLKTCVNILSISAKRYRSMCSFKMLIVECASEATIQQSVRN